jgi:5'-3' exonuclease
LKQQYLVGKIVFVFDGQILPGKKDEKEERLKKCSAKFVEAYEVHAKVGNKKKKKECLRDSLFITRDIYKVAIGVCRLLKCPAYVAISEADSQLAYMNRIGEIDIIVGDDGDFFIHGATDVLAGFIGGKRKGAPNARYPGYVANYKRDFKELVYKKSEEGKTKEVKADTSKWDHYDWLLLAICLGCDYGTIDGIGEVRAVPIVEELREKRTEGHTHWQWLDLVQSVLQEKFSSNIIAVMQSVRKCAFSYRTQWVYNTQVCDSPLRLSFNFAMAI